MSQAMSDSPQIPMNPMDSTASLSYRTGDVSEPPMAGRQSVLMRRRTEEEEPLTPGTEPPRIRSRRVTAVVDDSNHPEPRSPRFSLRKRATLMLTPEKPVGKPPNTWNSIRAIILNSWINVLLVFIPISWAFHFALPNQNTLVFVFSFLAIIPLAKLLAFATDELSMRVGQTLAGLLNATLGNTVELIVAIIALIKCQLSIVQSSLVGSILSNLLLVLGMCFFAGGVRYSEQGFGLSTTQINSQLLTVSVIAVLLPGAFHFALSDVDDNDEGSIDNEILKTSHGVAIVLLFIYASYLFFQLSTHKNLYSDGNADIQITQPYDENLRPFHRKHKKAKDNVIPDSNFVMNSPRSMHSHANGNGAVDHAVLDHAILDTEMASRAESEEEETPQMNVIVTICLLAGVTVLVAVTAEWLVDSINGLTASGVISTEFVGLILLPIVGNAAEHVTAVTVSVKDKLTLSLGVAVGSSIQVALFVIPFMITLGWILGKPLTLLFDPLESVVLFLSVLTVNYVVQDGKSNWLEGMILMCLYVIIAITFWFYPGTQGIFTTC